METVRFGVIGLGAMGSFHVGYLDKVEGATLGAVCDVDAERVERTAKKFESTPSPAGAPRGPVGRFGGYRELIDSGTVDAVLIATPHPQHPEVALAAFDKGLHVLCEKPVAVSVKEARRMNDAAARHPRVKFGLMYQMRTVPLYRKLRELIQDGELGEISRVTWLITDWFRTWTYYASGGWRATWSGEGGGVLINQCPHNLDLIPWLTGMMPTRVTAVAQIGKTHPIEVLFFNPEFQKKYQIWWTALLTTPGKVSGKRLIAGWERTPDHDRFSLSSPRRWRSSRSVPGSQIELPVDLVAQHDLGGDLAAPVRDPGGLPGQCLIATLR